MIGGLNKLSIFLAFVWMANSTEAQTPSAELIADNQEFCETGTIEFQVKFTGEAPFDARIGLVDANTGATKYSIWAFQNVTPPPEANGIVTGSIVNMGPDLLGGMRSGIKLVVLDAMDKNVVIAAENLTGEAFIRFDELPVPNAGSDLSECGYSVALNANPDALSENFYWQPVVGGSFGADNSDINNPKAVFSVEEVGIYPLTFVQENGVCVSASQVSVQLKGSPSGNISTNSEVCGSGQATINISLTGQEPFDFTYTDGNELFSRTGQSGIFYALQRTVTGETSFTLVSIKDATNCFATDEQMVGLATVVDLTPEAFAGDDGNVCGNYVTLNAVTPSVGTGLWSGTGGEFNNVASPKAIYTRNDFIESAIATLRWTVSNGECEVWDEVDVVFYEAPLAIHVNAGDDQELYHKFQTLLDADAPVVGTGIWTIQSGPGQIVNPNSEKADVTGLTFGTTTFLWTVTNGVCDPVSDIVSISILALKQYTGFSPDGNGINDFFRIEGAENITNNRLVVFNEVGGVVYSQNDFMVGDDYNGWNGRNMSGNQLPDGYYFYVFSGDGIKPVREYLIIKTVR